EQALDEQIERINQVDADPRDIAHTLATRTHFDHRAVILGNDTIRGTAHKTEKIVFVFPGQGSQWTGMGLALAQNEPVFRDKLHACAQALAPHTNWNLLDALADDNALQHVDIVQPALWAIMVSLAELWRSHGIHPDAVIGHSQGEIAAAHTAGILTLNDAAKTIALRSKALTQLAGTGAMASIPLPPDQITLPDGITIAALNGPTTTIVSGDPTTIQQIPNARRINVDYASHSPHVQTIKNDILHALADITPHQSNITFHSTVTNQPNPHLNADYWYQNLRQTVQFHPVINKLTNTHFIEISPHPITIPAIQDTHPNTPAHGTLHRNHTTFTHALAHAHTNGLTIPWHIPGHHTNLPTYPFQHQRHW
ncbi:acyltransferase domain-containing protein, partial [Spirillospora sp. NPDC048832]